MADSSPRQTLVALLQEGGVLADVLAKNEHYRILGIAPNGGVVVQRKATHEIQTLRANTINRPSSLMQLAPLNWWKSMTSNGVLGRGDRLVLANALIRRAEEAGVFHQNEALGRGAAVVNGGSLWNTGDQLLLEDAETGKLTVEAEFGDIDKPFLPGKPITMDRADYDEGRRAAADLYKVVMRYRWASRNDGEAFCGWIVSSLIGGALPSQPILWVLAERETAKTFLLTRFLEPALADCLLKVSDTSEAGVAASVGSDSLAVCIDDLADANRAAWNALLKVMRQLTSVGANVRGTPGGGHRVIAWRFSLLIASTTQPKLKPSDASKVMTVRLSHKNVVDWEALVADIAEVTQYKRMAAMRRAAIEDTARLVEAVEHMEVSIGGGDQYMSSRKVQLVATLTVGSRWLKGESTTPDSERPLVTPDEADRQPDGELDVLVALLRAEVGREQGGVLTLADALRRGWWDTQGGNEVFQAVDNRSSVGHGNRNMRELSAHYGCKMVDVKGEPVLALARAHPPLAGLLKQTRFANTDLTRYLGSLPGTWPHKSAKGNSVKMRFGKTQRYAVIVPSSVLSGTGLVT